MVETDDGRWGKMSMGKMEDVDGRWKRQEPKASNESKQTQKKSHAMRELYNCRTKKIQQVGVKWA